VKALVLAAGKGERLRPLTDVTPKPLLQVGGRPLIHYALLMLKRAGITRVAINLHHHGAAIERALGSGAELGLEILWAPEPALLGTGGPLLALRDYLSGERFVVANSDTIMDADLSRVLDFHRRSQAMATLLLRPLTAPGAYSRIEAQSDGRIVRMNLLERRVTGRSREFALPGTGASGATQPFMFCGLSVCEPQVLEHLPPAAPFALVEGLYGPMMTRGARLFGYPHEGYFRTVDDVGSYKALCAEFNAEPPRLSYIDLPAV
jgi:NDP-sugar pyrophosphorylase family protein